MSGPGGGISILNIICAHTCYCRHYKSTVCFFVSLSAPWPHMPFSPKRWVMPIHTLDPYNLRFELVTDTQSYVCLVLCLLWTCNMTQRVCVCLCVASTKKCLRSTKFREKGQTGKKEAGSTFAISNV
jgi:hypothetical protein